MEEFQWDKVNNVKCLKTLFNNHSKNGKLPKKEQDRRRDVKDTVGSTHPGTIILDSTSQNKFCNALVYAPDSQTLKEWVQNHIRLYKSKDCILDTKNLKHGTKYEWSNDGNIYIVVTSYLNKKKMLVQGGESDAHNDILSWINDVSTYNLLVKNKVISEMQEDCCSAELVVNIPPLEKTNPSKHTLPIINELLCFTQNMINRLPVEHVVKLCTDYYSAEVIIASKHTLYDNTSNNNRRFRNHQGPNMAHEHMRDVALLFHSADPKDVPNFCAKDLGNLPPLGPTNFDMVRILKEVEAVKTNIQMLGDSQKVLANLVGERLVQPIPKPVAHTMPTTSQPTPHQPAPSLSPPTTDNNQIEEQDYTILDYTSCSDSGSTDDVIDINTTAERDDANLSLEDDVIFADAMQEIRHRNPHNRYIGSQRVRKSGQSSQLRTSSYQHRARYSSDRRRPKQPKSEVVFGTGIATDIRAVRGRREQQSGEQRKARSVTGVFITRLDPRLSAIKLGSFIRRETGLTVRPQKLDTKYQTYSSYYIPSNGHMRQTLMDPSLWPSGTLLKPFYN